jgi:pimeloyl-ACP methyl ester carboxylesterase
MIEEFMASQAEVPVYTFYQDFLACSVFDVTQRMDEINLPTLIVVGLDDKMTPVKLANFLHDSIKGSQLATIEKAGHMTMIETPDELSRIIAEFVGLS